jgi:hypothetical protein
MEKTAMSVTDTKTKSMTAQEMRALLDKQRTAYLKDGPPSAEVRIDRLDRCVAILVDHQDEIADALNRDFGSRSPQMSKFTDVSGSIGPLPRRTMQVDAWKPSQTAILGWFGAKPKSLPTAGCRRCHRHGISRSISPSASRRHSGGGMHDQAVGFTPA